MDQKFRDTVLQGILPFRFEIFFSVIGLAFLLPVEISFSLWAFYILMVAEQFVAVRFGYGIDGRSFRCDWYTGASFMSAQGGGALQVFGLIYLWRVRHQVFAFVYRLARPQGTAALAKEEIARYWWPSLLFLLASGAVIWFMRIGHVSWGMAILVYFTLLILTIALVRLVAECGLVSFQIFFGPFHMMKIFGLLRFPTLFAAKGLGTVMVLVSGLFLDMKTFIAPAMMNAKYLASRNKIRESSFVLSLLIGIILTLVVSAGVTVVLAYDLGLGSMNSWFFSAFPRNTFNNIESMMSAPESMTSIDAGLLPWFLVGAASCGTLIYLRQFLFWLPHPIGLLMFSNNLARSYWFSFFLAWLCKRAAVKYCNEEQYRTIRGFFIGLIVGAVVAVGMSTVLSLFFGMDISVTLNPHSQR